jgi:hypothetical protein
METVVVFGAVWVLEMGVRVGFPGTRWGLWGGAGGRELGSRWERATAGAAMG